MVTDDTDSRGLQAVLEAIVARRLEESLVRVEEALACWRRGESGALGAHAEVMRHAARAGALVDRVGRAALDGPELLLRDGFAVGVVTREEFERFVGRPVEEVALPPSLDEEAARQPAAPGHDKKGVLEKLLGEGAVLVHVDARQDGVAVPPAHKADPRLVLRLGYRLSPPIPDLRIEADGVRATLSFHGAQFGCVLPWQAIYGIVSEEGRGMLWPEDMPAEVARELARDAGSERKDGAGEGAGHGDGTSARLGPVESIGPVDDEGASGKVDRGPKAPGSPRRGHLRLV